MENAPTYKCPIGGVTRYGVPKDKELHRATGDLEKANKMVMAQEGQDVDKEPKTAASSNDAPPGNTMKPWNDAVVTKAEKHVPEMDAKGLKLRGTILQAQAPDCS